MLARIDVHRFEMLMITRPSVVVVQIGSNYRPKPLKLAKNRFVGDIDANFDPVVRENANMPGHDAVQ